MKMGCRSRYNRPDLRDDTPVALKDLEINKAKAKEKSYKLYDSLGQFVLVKPNGSRLWRQKHTQLRHSHMYSLRR
jgi:hypothetical protein